MTVTRQTHQPVKPISAEELNIESDTLNLWTDGSVRQNCAYSAIYNAPESPMNCTMKTPGRQDSDHAELFAIKMPRNLPVNANSERLYR